MVWDLWCMAPATTGLLVIQKSRTRKKYKKHEIFLNLNKFFLIQEIIKNIKKNLIKMRAKKIMKNKKH